MDLALFIGAFFLLQLILIAGVIAFLRIILENKLIENTFKDFELYAPSKNSVSPVEVVVTSHKKVSEGRRQKLQTLAQQKFGPAVNVLYEMDKKILGGIVIRIDQRVIGHSLLDRLREGGIVK